MLKEFEVIKKPKTIYLKDYKKPDYLVSEIFLTFNLEDQRTVVESKMKIKWNGSENDKLVPLKLDGEKLLCKSVKVNGADLHDDQFVVGDNFLIINEVCSEFEVEIVNEINPKDNKSLEGLYKSSGIFCTQNEPEGFRRITYFLDRPDVMSTYSTKVIADKKLYPTLLSNGNPIDRGELDDEKHWVLWQDPFPKPAYLYALVAGDLGLVEDNYTTKSGREVELKIYCDKGNEYKCSHAMESLKKSMKWDEDVFGLEYDLDIYMIVAVDSFNMGAMENKGLNIFNSAYVLADPKTATDDDYMGIESVIAHEYFHNWTGNRVTCRDWFQLTLKEGLTVFRDQEFSADMNSRDVERISSVIELRMRQFREDSGPMSHPIKPDSYIEINNFYTSTVYEKGAEVVRMIYNLIGRDNFCKGISKYFELFDGKAVTTDDFIYAMELSSDFKFDQFKRWYSQAGTPEIDVKTSYDENKKEYYIEIEQLSEQSTSKKEKECFYFPLKVGLINKKGENVLNDLIHIKNNKEKFTFKNIEDRPTLSINRGFTAPIKVNSNLTEDDLVFLMAHDDDGFNRFEAAFQLGKRKIENLVSIKDRSKWEVDSIFLDAFGNLINDKTIDNSFKSLIMVIPAIDNIIQNQKVIDIDGVFQAREFLKRKISTIYKNELMNLYEENIINGEYSLDPESIGKRSLKNTAMSYLASLQEKNIFEIIYKQFSNATNMTDEISSLAMLTLYENKFMKEALLSFYNKWKHETLVIQKWIAIQAMGPLDLTYNKVLELEKSDVYDSSVPNLVYSLFGVFARNHMQFNHSSGRGYKLIADKIVELDSQNPQIASSLATSFNYFKHLIPANQKLMQNELHKIVNTSNISKNVYEIVSKILK